MRAAKFPAIDFHGHPQGLVSSSEGLERLGVTMDSLNLRLMVAANNMSGDGLKQTLAAIAASPRIASRSLMHDFEWMIDELHICGDAVVPRGLGQSIHDGYRLGCRI